MRAVTIVSITLLIAPLSPAQTPNAPKALAQYLKKAASLLDDAPAHLKVCNDTGWQVDKAAEHLRAALALSPRSAEALSLMGAVLYRQGAYREGPAQARLFEEAAASFRQALDADPNNIRAHEGFTQLIKGELVPIIESAPRTGKDIPADQREWMRQKADEGAAHARLVLAANPKSVVALSALVEMARTRATLSRSREEFRGHLREANEWYRQASAAPSRPLRPCELNAILGSIPSEAPKPPK